MLYLIRPSHTVDWIDLPSKLVEIAQEHDEIDLAGLDWRRVEQFEFSSTVLRLGFRYGIPCSAGIVVRATDLVSYAWALEAFERANKPTPCIQDLPGQGLMEALMPGWAQHVHELDTEVAASAWSNFEKLGDDLAEELSKPVRPELVQHWRDLGGVVPDPA